MAMRLVVPTSINEGELLKFGLADITDVSSAYYVRFTTNNLDSGFYFASPTSGGFRLLASIFTPDKIFEVGRVKYDYKTSGDEVVTAQLYDQPINEGPWDRAYGDPVQFVISDTSRDTSLAFKSSKEELHEGGSIYIDVEGAENLGHKASGVPAGYTTGYSVSTNHDQFITTQWINDSRLKVSYKNDLIYRSLTDFSLKIS